MGPASPEEDTAGDTASGPQRSVRGAVGFTAVARAQAEAPGHCRSVTEADEGIHTIISIAGVKMKLAELT